MRMNKGMLLGLAFCTAFTANAQKRLQLDVKIKGLPQGDTVFLWGPLTNTIDTGYVKNDHFSINADMSQGGSTYILQIGTNGKQEQGTFLYLEAGKINITGNGPFFENATYTGSPFVADWVDIRKNVLSKETGAAEIEALQAKLENATKLGDEDAQAQIKAEMNKLMQPMSEAALDWVKKHPNAGASSFLINAQLSQVLSKEDIKDLMTSLGPDAKNTFTIKKMMTQYFGGSAMANLMNKPAPAITVNDTDGKPVSLADFKGKYVLLDFWASWCKPCREAIPALSATYNKYKDKGFTILSVSLDDKKDKWMQAIGEEKMPWAQVSDLKGGGSPVAAQYGVAAIPAAFLISPDGTIIEIGAVGERLEKKLSEVLK